MALGKNNVTQIVADAAWDRIRSTSGYSKDDARKVAAEAQKQTLFSLTEKYAKNPALFAQEKERVRAIAELCSVNLVPAGQGRDMKAEMAAALTRHLESLYQKVVRNTHLHEPKEKGLEVNNEQPNKTAGPRK